jgi:hypothetical protein
MSTEPAAARRSRFLHLSGIFFEVDRKKRMYAVVLEFVVRLRSG